MCNRNAQGTPDTRPSSGGHRVAAQGALLPGHGLLTRKLGDLRQGGDGSSSSEGRPAGGLSGLQRHACRGSPDTSQHETCGSEELPVAAMCVGGR